MRLPESARATFFASAADGTKECSVSFVIVSNAVGNDPHDLRGATLINSITICVH